jgi:hypothetical protein
LREVFAPLPMGERPNAAHWLVAVIKEFPVNFTRLLTICTQAETVELPPL